MWLYLGVGGWHFITLPEKPSAKIRYRFGMFAKGWGSLPAVVTIGRTNWKTSIFPDKKSKGYLLPIKEEVRRRESVKANAVVNTKVQIRF